MYSDKTAEKYFPKSRSSSCEAGCERPQKHDASEYRDDASGHAVHQAKVHPVDSLHDHPGGKRQYRSPNS
jgi:hypothetical protein